MGRHRRSTAAPAAHDYADGTERSHRGGARRKKRAGIPVRTGLLGASAAMAVGAVAVASGLLPGGDTFNVSGDSEPSGQIRTEGSAKLQTQGDASAEPTNSVSASPSRTAPRPQAPSKTPSPTPTKPQTKPSATPSKQTKAPVAEQKTKSASPTRTETRAPDRAAARKPATSTATAAEAEVLTLVNKERAKVGCSPVRPDDSLADLAGNFSADMATRAFFDHTDPDGDSPWDRAAQVGIQGLGGENIARGQADAAAVMNSWMNSDGHRANILNCDYKTMGVGVVMGDGGPWWTQDFGF
ncbi:CAP domain-containing protein [Streptomyces sp. NBC_00210]|uniref:CAP domain-containing protein n=1 Tax=unclassified Streptomyces TaxID=2593676 RepID=UPI003250D3E5